jgi:hypothetical protein
MSLHDAIEQFLLIAVPALLLILINALPSRKQN